MRRSLLITILVIIMLSTPVYCDESEGIFSKQLDNIDIAQMQKFADNLSRETQGYMPDINIKKIVLGLFKGNVAVNFKNMFAGMGRYFIKEIIMNFSLLGKIVILAVFCAMLQNLHSAFEGESVGKLAYSICYMLLIILSITSFYTAVKIGTSAIDSMVSFMQSLLPTLLILLASVGGITSATVFQPLIFASISVISTIIKTVVIPMIMFSAVLTLIDNVSETVQISRLSSLIRQFALAIMGVSLTAFVGVVSVQGIAASSADGISIKTAKFAVDKFIPVVGGFLKDAFDTIVSCTHLIKNGVGIAGLLILILVASIPVIKMLAVVIIYKVSSALIQPISDNQLVQCLNDMGNTLMLLLTCVMAVGVMFFVAITIIMGVGNMTVMMR